MPHPNEQRPAPAATGREPQVTDRAGGAIDLAANTPSPVPASADENEKSDPASNDKNDKLDGNRRAAKKQADILIELANAAELFHAPDGTGFVDHENGEHRETSPIRS